MAKSTKAHGTPTKAATKPAKAVKASSATSGTAGKTTGKATAKAAGRTTRNATEGAGRKRLARGGPQQLRRVEALAEEVAGRLVQLQARYSELDEIEPDVGAGEDEGGASFDPGLVERDQIRSMIADDELLLRRLREAAERVHAGTWRTCRVCQGDIGEARLEVLPGTDLCVSCKAAGH